MPSLYSFRFPDFTLRLSCTVTMIKCTSTQPISTSVPSYMSTENSFFLVIISFIIYFLQYPRLLLSFKIHQYAARVLNNPSPFNFEGRLSIDYLYPPRIFSLNSLVQCCTEHVGLQAYASVTLTILHPIAWRAFSCKLVQSGSFDSVNDYSYG